MERILRERGIWLYRYVPDVDRLVAYRHLAGSAASRDGWVPSDDWYRILSERRMSVDVAFEVGVGSGYTSVWISRWAGRVFSFEPNATNQSMIREQLAIRGVENVELVPAAVSNTDGLGTLHVKPHAGHHSLGDIGASETINTVEVRTLSLDSFARERGVDRVGFLIVDTEGFEPDVLEGAAGLLGRRAIDLVMIEFSPAFYADRGLDPRAPLALLEGHGYRLFHMTGEPVDAASIGLDAQVDLLAEPDAMEPPTSD